MSTFIRKYGTFASRVKFGDLRTNVSIDQAFFLYGSTVHGFHKNKEIIQNTDEMDFEWCSGQYDVIMMAGINNHDYKIPIHIPLKCIAVDKNHRLPLNSMYEDFLGRQPIANQWATCLFVCDSASKKIKISMRVSDFDGTGYQIYGSDYSNVDDYDKPYTINNYELFTSMNVFYGYGTALFDKAEMDADWFYYSARTDMDFDAIEDSVKSLRKNGIVRINTAGAEFHNDFMADKPGEFFLDGPVEIEACKEYQWIIKAHDYRISAYDTELLYRYHLKIGGWENWRQHYSIYPVLTSEPFYDSLEFHAICKDHWVKYADTVDMKIHISDGTNSYPSVVNLKDPIPNPANTQVTLEFTLNKSADISLTITDESGNLISEITSGYYQAGNYFLLYKVDQLHQGVYFIYLKTNLGTAMKRLIISRARQ